LPVVTVVGGSDPSAGAGIQADVRSLEMLGVAATTVVTAVTVQDGRSVQRVEAVAPDLVADQLAAVLAAFSPCAIKCGLLPTVGTVDRVAAAMHGRETALVVDPVLNASAGPSLVAPDVADALAEILFPAAAVVTFNLEEAEHYAGVELASLEDVEGAARCLARRGPAAVVVKGGHLAERQSAGRRPVGSVTDVLWDGRRIHRFVGERRRCGDLHGSGCAFASAVAAALASGVPVVDAVERAGEHVRGLIDGAMDLGGGVLLRRPPR